MTITLDRPATIPAALITHDGESRAVVKVWPDGSWSCPFCDAPVISPAGHAESQRLNAESYAKRGEAYSPEPYAGWMRRQYEARECPNPACVVYLTGDQLTQYRRRQAETERRETERRARAEREAAEREAVAQAARDRADMLASVRPAALQLGFAWACVHHTAIAWPDEPCMTSGYDAGEYAEHMAGHGARALSPSVRPVKLRRKVPAAPLRKAEADILAPVTWSQMYRAPAYCACGHQRDSHKVWHGTGGPVARCPACECETSLSTPGYMLEAVTVQRTGQFLAEAGPHQWWVIPFEPAPWETGRAAPVVIQLPGKRNRVPKYVRTA